MGKKRPEKKRGLPRSRFRKGDDAADQLESIRNAQARVRRGEAGRIIDSTDNSEQRFQNALDAIRDASDANEEFEE